MMNMTKKNNVWKSLIVTMAIALAITASLTPVSAAVAESKPAISDIEFLAGGLSLTQVPSVSFGTQTISEKTETYASVGGGGDVVVSDARGSGAGWKVTVSLDQFTNGGSATLEGAELMLEAPMIHALNGTVEANNKPVDRGIIKMIAGDSVEHVIIEALAGTGKGTWGATVSSANLTVLGGTAEAGLNTSTLNWVLHDTP